MKKEELEQEVEKYKEKARVGESVANGLHDRDERIRREFAKAFNWQEKNGYYSEEIGYAKPTWEEIFIEIGKLLSVYELDNIRKDIKFFQKFMKNFENRMTKLEDEKR